MLHSDFYLDQIVSGGRKIWQLFRRSTMFDDGGIVASSPDKANIQRLLKAYRRMEREQIGSEPWMQAAEGVRELEVTCAA